MRTREEIEKAFKGDAVINSNVTRSDGLPHIETRNQTPFEELQLELLLDIRDLLSTTPKEH